MNIHLHIDRIVVDGAYATEDQTNIVYAAVQEELVRLLAVHGISPSLAGGGAIQALAGGTLETRPGSAPRVLGTGIGRAVHDGLRTISPTASGIQP